MADGGGGEGAEGGGSAEWLPIFDRVEAMVSKSEAQAEAVAADRARLEAANRVQRESWEAARRLQRSVEELQAAAREKEAEMDRLRAEAADARKKLQEVHEADASRKMRWEAASVELLLGANQKLAELRDGDIVDSRTCAETPSLKLNKVERCARLNGNSADHLHLASDISVELRKLKQAYVTLSSNKDKEVSALLSEKDSVHNQLSIMQQDYAALLKNKKVESAQATGAALKLQQIVDELKVLAQKKDDEIVKLQAEAVDAKKKLMKMRSLVQEKDDEIQRLKCRHPRSIRKCNKDINETHKNVRSDDPSLRGKSENNSGNGGQDETSQKRRRVSSISNDEDGNEQSGSDGDDGGRSGSDEDDGEQIGRVEDGDEQSGSDEDDGEQSGSDEDGDEQSGSDEDDDGQSRSDEHENEQHGSDGVDDEQSGSDEEGANNQVQKILGSSKRKRDAFSAQIANSKSHNEINRAIKSWYSYRMAPRPLRSKKLEIRNSQRVFVHTGNWGNYVRLVNDSLVDKPDKRKEFLWFLCNFENWRVRDVIRTMDVVLDRQPKLIRQFNRFLPKHLQIEVEEEEEKQQPEDEPYKTHKTKGKQMG